MSSTTDVNPLCSCLQFLRLCENLSTELYRSTGLKKCCLRLIKSGNQATKELATSVRNTFDSDATGADKKTPGSGQSQNNDQTQAKVKPVMQRPVAHSAASSIPKTDPTKPTTAAAGLKRPATTALAGDPKRQVTDARTGGDFLRRTASAGPTSKQASTTPKAGSLPAIATNRTKSNTSAGQSATPVTSTLKKVPVAPAKSMATAPARYSHQPRASQSLTLYSKPAQAKVPVKSMPKVSIANKPAVTRAAPVKTNFSFAATMAKLSQAEEPKKSPEVATLEQSEESPEEKAKRLRKEQRRKLRVKFRDDADLVEIREYELQEGERLGTRGKKQHDVSDAGGEGQMLKRHMADAEDETVSEELAPSSDSTGESDDQHVVCV